MATSHQPLLGTPNTNSSPCKSLCLILSLAAIIASVSIVTTNLINNNAHPSDHPFLLSHICAPALDQASCLSMVSELLASVSAGKLTQINDLDLLQLFLKDSASSIQKTMEIASEISHRINDPREQAAMADCMELMDVSRDRIMDSIEALGNSTSSSRADAHSWLSSVLTNHVTCRDGLNGPLMEAEMKDLIARARTSLAMVVAVISPPPLTTIKNEIFRPLSGRFPSWVTARDRKLLEGAGKDIKADVVVAQDGSGKYKTVKEAVDSAPNNGKSRYVIYVKKGSYKENVEIGTSKKNVMLVGDGMDSTIITGSLNVVDGSTTFKSATVAAVGDGFIAQDIWFQNTAGPQKHQAVALRVGADRSVINRCRIDAFQDTLYAHSNRQFYRDSYITGTVDFIFGNAAVVFQNCKIVARKAMAGQNNMVTAQGREDPNQNTGISIQNCNVIASSDLQPVKGTIKSYLGRPWKQYSRTVFMQSYIGDHIDPAGWSVWSGDFALKTLYYGEYMNNGPGAGTGKRVKWPGYHVITNPAEARKFTVAELIQGGVWLKSTGVAYTEGL